MNTKITEDEKRNREELFRLMREHPELPVIPMVNTEVVAGDDYAWWMGSFGRVELAGYILARDRVLIRDWDDDESVLGMLDECIGWEGWPDEKVDAAVKAFPWVECIMVQIVAGIVPRAVLPGVLPDLVPAKQAAHVRRHQYAPGDP